jgi:hypothetical protein
MSDYTHTDLKVVGRHVPDENAGPFENAQQAQAAGYDTTHPVTGTYEIGVVIEDAFVPIISEKASLVFDRIEVAAQQAADAKKSGSSKTKGSGAGDDASTG